MTPHAELLAATLEWRRALSGLLWVTIVACTAALLAAIGALAVGHATANHHLSAWGRRTLLVAAASAFITGGTGTILNWAVNTAIGPPSDQPAEVRREKPAERPTPAQRCDVTAALHSRC